MTKFDELPEDLLLNIFKLCDVETLLRISLTCRRFYLCIDKEIFWKQKLQSLYSQLDVPLKKEPKTSYKSACLRFCAVFSDENLHGWTDCCRCQDIFCASSCIQDRDEVIIFDFGSKTTWFKYASDSTGQLSMHPTVAPSQPESARTHTDSASAESLDIYQSCPVCSKMFQNKSLSLTSSERDVKVDVLKTERSSSRRLTSAFSRLAMRHFPSCFESTDISDDVLSLGGDLQPSSFAVLSESSDSHRDVGCDSSITDLSQSMASSVDRLTSSLSPLPVVQASQLSPNSAPSPNSSSQACANSVVTYQFLIKHMLKRNPFFQARCIPFVLCEPTNCSADMKIELLQFLFTDIKVPGVCYIPKPVATALYSGLDTCLVIDSGAHNTIVTPVVDQLVLSHYVQTKHIGGAFLTNRLHECIQVKGVNLEVDEANLDSSQVKRECYLAYNVDAESRRTKAPNEIHVKGHRNGRLEYEAVGLGPQLYLTSEDMYLNMALPDMVKQAVKSLDGSTIKKLLSNILLTGGNCRLNGLALRLTKDLQQLLPEYQSILKVVDPRLMTGRTDAVIGASYIRKWFDAFWVTRQDYILHGATASLEKTLVNQVHCV